jgi:radical SAM enzyme (TIGR01210 family)
MKDQELYSRSAVIDRITSRAWIDEPFRDLLFRSPCDALVEEFGKVPEGFENVTFKASEVDRAILRDSPQGKSLLVRAKRGNEPLSVVMRQVFGVSELVVVFYTKRCQYQCSFCTLPSTSAYSDISMSSIQKQLEHALEYAGVALNSIKQVSLGNEGSILDERTFSREQLEYVLTKCARLSSVQEIVLETRAEFVSESLLDDILAWISPCKLTLKIGLESADETIREKILRKKMDLKYFERIVEMLGRKGVGLASYILLKADPSHSNEQGMADARKSCNYLKDLCQRCGTQLTLRINTMYCADNSLWAQWAVEQKWEPPSIFDLAEVMLDVYDDNVQVFAGLYDEGLATRNGHYEVRSDFQQWALDILEQYNQTMDIELLRQVANHRRGGICRSKSESMQT